MSSGQTGRKRRGGRRKPAFLEGFFAQYPEFDFDNTASASDEFYRMCDFFDWSRQDPDRETARAEYRTALTQQFNSNYGTDVDDLASWQHLCRVIGLYPVPDDMVTARSVPFSIHRAVPLLTDRHCLDGEVYLCQHCRPHRCTQHWAISHHLRHGDGAERVYQGHWENISARRSHSGRAAEISSA